MTLHNLFGKHLPDHVASRWDCGHFVTRCTVCGKAMIKLPGMTWQLR
jgi:hypothetical protein